MRPQTGIEIIAEERQRQIDEEGWTAEHDDQHVKRELVLAAICYLLYSNKSPDDPVLQGLIEGIWPWDRKWWKPKHHDIRNLKRAGALIAAEIDRLIRRRIDLETEE